MKNQDNANPTALLSHPIRFVTTYEEAVALMENNPHVGEFIVIGDNVRKVPAPVQALFKDKGIRSFRIRASGTWNTLFKTMGEVDGARSRSEGYFDAKDLMFISLLSAHDISSALNRHRAVNQISCREMYWLDTIDLGEEADDSIAMALCSMPSVLTPIAYKDLSVKQRFELTAFEFGRFTRPIHCVSSVDNSYNAIPFYTNPGFGKTFESTRPTAPAANADTIGQDA